MKRLKVKCPAKINLTLEVLNKREDGFHNIKSIMQAIDLYDYITIEITDTNITDGIIELAGNSTQIPYDEKNLVYKAAKLFIEKANLKNQKISIYIEKNIPVEAGLAGGSTDGAGTFYALNKLYNTPLTDDELNKLCETLGSDLNFCLSGGTAICTGRGEKIQKIPTVKFELSLIKPTSFGISAKEAYQKFAAMKDKSIPNNTEKLAQKLSEGVFDSQLVYNSLQNVLINDYEELILIKNKYKNSLMSGSGPTFMVFENKIKNMLPDDKFIKIEGLKTISSGVETA